MQNRQRVNEIFCVCLKTESSEMKLSMSIEYTKSHKKKCYVCENSLFFIISEDEEFLCVNYVLHCTKKRE